MPILSEGKRFLTETLATRINEMVFGLEGSLGITTELALNIKEVALQYRNPSDTTEVIPLYRYSFQPFSKTSRNEIRFSILIEVN